MAASNLDEAAIFNAARQMEDPVARQSYLRQACGENGELRRRIEALLRVHEEQRGILHSPTEEFHAILGASGSANPNTPIVSNKLLEKIGLNLPTSDSALSPAEAPDEIGRLGGYRVLKVLGAGGMGIVYQAEDVQLQRPIALKVMKAELAQDPSNRERFLREARAVARLKSDHVVHIYQVGEERQTVFFAMEYLEGMSLADWLKKDDKPTAAEAARIGRQIALGLADAHACGLIHRDIKPGNVWMDSRHQGRVKLLDFGLARGDTEETHLTQTGAIVGTPEYMAPEQARGDKVDLRCDLFSLGVVLYRLTTGKMPFRGANTMAILTALAVDTPPAPRQLNPATPPRLSTLIERLLSKDREKRPATARAVAEELAFIENEATVEAASDSTPVIAVSSIRAPVVASVHSCSRLRWHSATSALLLLVVAVAAVLVLFAKRDRGLQDGPESPGTNAAIVGKEGPLAPQAELGDLETLDPAKIPEEERIPGLPRETVAVLGSHRGWHRDAKGECGSFLAYAPDGRRIVTVLGGPGGIHLWDAESLRELGRIALPRNFVTGLALSPDGKSLALAMGEDNGRVRFWDISGDKPAERLPTLENKDSIHGLTYSPDNKTLACLVADRALVRLWDLTAMPPRVRAELPQANKDAPPTFSPDGKTLVYGDGKTGLLVWDMSVTPPLKTTVFRKDGGFFRTAFSSDSATLAADGDNAVWLLDWNGTELKKRAVFPTPEWKGHTLSSLMFASQGKKLAFSRIDNGPRLVDWSGPHLSEIAFDDYETEPFNLVAFSLYGRSLATLSWAYGGAKLRAWDMTGAIPRERNGIAGHVNTVRALAFSRDGKLLASGDEKTIRLWRPIGGRLVELAVLECPGSMHKLALSPDGKTLAVVGKDTLRLWDISGPRPEERLTARSDTWAIALSPDGQTLAWGEGADVRLHDLSKRKPVEKAILRGHQKIVTALAFSPDGQTLASSGRENTVRLWDLTQKESRVRTIIRLPNTHERDEQVLDLAFLPDGKRLLVQRLSIGQVWDAALPIPQMEWEFTCNGRELCMTPARDGKSIFAIGNRRTREVLQRWFSPSDMRPWWIPGDHPCMALAEDGRHLAIGNANGTIYVLRLPPLTTAHPPLEDTWIKEVAALPLQDQIEAVAKELKRRNPDFDGELQHRIENDELVEVDFALKRIFDLTPLQVLRPRKLILSETYCITDLSPLRGLPLEALYLGENSRISDFSPLKDLPLRILRFDVSFETERLAPLRSIKTLQTINDKPAAEFWKQVDAAKQVGP